MTGLTHPTGPGPAASSPGRGEHAPPTGPVASVGYRRQVEQLLVVVARAALEVLAGRRRLRQLLRLVSPSVYDRLEARVPVARRRRCAPTAATVHRLLADWPTPRACEATVLVEQAGRITALALRAERYHHRWRVVEIAAPEEGLPPISTSSTHRGPDPPG